MKWSAAPVDEVPLGVTTVTSTVPVDDAAGSMAIKALSDRTLNEVAAVVPKLTNMAPVK